MRATSLRDIMLADSLKHIKSEVLLINPVNDVEVRKVLEQIGYDVKQPFEYVASKHRDLRNRVAIGFQVVGEYSRDPKYRHFLDTTDRVIVAGLSDASLAKEMSALQGVKSTYKNSDDKWDDGARARPDDARYYSDSQLLEMGFTKGGDEDDPYEGEYIEERWEEDLRAITTLQEICDETRKDVK